MKILLTGESYWPSRGGCQEVVRQLAVELVVGDAKECAGPLDHVARLCDARHAAHDARDYLYAVYSGRARTIHVAFLPHLDGGGSWFGQDYKRWLPRHIGSSFGTAFELCAGPAFIGCAEFSQQGL
jgi:hypothetical protein